MNLKKDVDDLQAQLGYRPLNRSWAKLEIVLGLSAAGIGLLLADWAMSRPTLDLSGAAVGLILWVLGNYLALAGHRSHLYQSNNELTAFLVGELRRSQEKG